MLKLTLWQQLRILLWRHRRGLIITLLSLLAVALTMAGASSLPTLMQLAIGSLVVMFVILLSD